MDIINDTPQNEEKFYMRYGDYIFCRGVGWFGIFLYAFIGYCYYFHPKNDLLMAIFVLIGLFWAFFIYLSIRYGYDCIKRNKSEDKLKKEKAEKIREEKKKSLIEKYTTTRKIFVSFTGKCDDQQGWLALSHKDNSQPEEIHKIYSGFTEIEKMLNNL